MSKHPAGEIGSALDALTARLAQRGVESPRLAAELLVAHIVGCPRLELYARCRDALSDAQRERLETLARRAEDHEPIAYALGTADFMGCLLRVDPRVLVPRPETELLVEAALACDDLWQRPQPHVADIGTGSGCIAISLALRRPQVRLTATDVSAEALEAARENARAAGVEARVHWRETDVLDGFEPGSLDAIVANLPYIPTGQLGTLPENVRRFEPIRALAGGPDGLSLISRLVVTAPKALKSDGWLFMELGDGQASTVISLMAPAPWREARVLKDLAGKDRIVQGQLG